MLSLRLPLKLDGTKKPVPSSGSRCRYFCVASTGRGSDAPNSPGNRAVQLFGRICHGRRDRGCEPVRLKIPGVGNAPRSARNQVRGPGAHTSYVVTLPIAKALLGLGAGAGRHLRGPDNAHLMRWFRTPTGPPDSNSPPPIVPPRREFARTPAPDRSSSIDAPVVLTAADQVRRHRRRANAVDEGGESCAAPPLNAILRQRAQLFEQRNQPRRQSCGRVVGQFDSFRFGLGYDGLPSRFDHIWSR
jgi:hypothetical protein